MPETGSIGDGSFFQFIEFKKEFCNFLALILLILLIILLFILPARPVQRVTIPTLCYFPNPSLGTFALQARACHASYEAGASNTGFPIGAWEPTQICGLLCLSAFA